MTTDAERFAHLDRLLHGGVCFDATVPLYIADAGHASTLAAAFRDRSMMPTRVEKELFGLSFGGHPKAVALLQPKPFARTIALTDAEDDRVLNRRRLWNGDRAFEFPNEDRGEAECLEICHRYKADDVAICAHDHKAIRDARTEGIRIFNAIDICLVFALSGGLSDQAAWELYLELVTVHGMWELRSFPTSQVGRVTFETLMFNSRRVLAAAGGQP